MTDMEPFSGASDLILNMYPVACEVHMAEGSDQIMGPGGAAKTSRGLDDDFASYDVDPVYQEMARVLQRKGATRTAGECPVCFDPLGRTGGSSLAEGPETLVPILRAQDASPSRADRPLVSASS